MARAPFEPRGAPAIGGCCDGGATVGTVGAGFVSRRAKGNWLNKGVLVQSYEG